MTTSQRVLWEEGMFLGPQHFQQWERFLLRQLHGRAAATAPHGYGWTELAVHEAALQGSNPSFGITKLSGVLQDGTVVDVPGIDRAPPARDLEKVFGPRQPHLIAYVGAPTARIGAMVTRDDSATPGRYRRRLATIVDEDKGVLERDVALGELELRIVFENEATDDLTLLPVARLTRGAGAAITLDDEFVPPVLWTGASRAIATCIERLLSYATSKTEVLARKHGQRLGGRAQFTAIDASGFWLLKTLNTHLPLLAHHNQERRQHPERLYRDLATLIGALSTFAKINPTDSEGIPPYDHEHPGAVFQRLEQLVFEYSRESATETCESVPLHEKGPPGEYAGQVLDVSLLENADFYVAVRSDASADVVIREFPFAAKLGSPDGVSHARSRAIRGVKMTHVATPPADIPQPGGFHYFVVDTADDQWTPVREAHAVELYVPPKFPDVTVELFAVRRKV
ncbi:MAG: type VI secretion system baseplate subunit TssK [Planctomycetes bacterium]|nr:type VI secretion system baseplate subunit TssK [Planctomycetota bacterium]